MTYTTQTWVAMATQQWHGRWDYSLVDYVDSKTKVTIICRVEGHGQFRQRPNNHMNGHACPKCADEHRKLITRKHFIGRKNILKSVR